MIHVKFVTRARAQVIILVKQKNKQTRTSTRRLLQISKFTVVIMHRHKDCLSQYTYVCHSADNSISYTKTSHNVDNRASNQQCKSLTHARAHTQGKNLPEVKIKRQFSTWQR